VGELEDYFAAWNEPDRDRRSELLARAVTADVELIHPTWGRSAGVDALVEHIDGYRSALPETTVVLAIGTDGHNPVVRYAWEVVDRDGKPVLDGLDVMFRQVGQAADRR
jgi:hypothetical protein